MSTARGRRAIRLCVSIGCPSGIGPEVSLVGAIEMLARSKGVRVLLVGDVGAVRAAAKARRIDPATVVRVERAEEAFSRARASDLRHVFVLEPRRPLTAAERKPGRSGGAAGAAQLAWIDVATDLVTRGVADALVTGPVSKDAIARSGAKGARGFLGHTEHLARRLGAPEVTMAFHTEALTTSLVTTHLPIASVARSIERSEVARAAHWTAWLVDRLYYARKSPRRSPRSATDDARAARPRTKTPRIAVAALNPHAGENGLLGDEETREIEPGIALARKRIARAGFAVDLEGPVPAESAFRLAAKGRYAAVVAMYHDQATIPMKLLGFGEAVNVSLGLPIVRTSVDHGTAYDRAGRGTADARGMIEAMQLAERLVRAASNAKRRADRAASSHR